MKKLFIVFEGIDGSGTSTQSKLLRDYLTERGQSAVLTAEPTNGPIGHLLREGLKERVIFSKDEKRFDQQMAYLFAADRHDHLYNHVDGVYKLLGEGKHVVCTRYSLSSLAYQSDEEGYEFVYDLNKRFPNPDLVIYIDNPVETSIDRLQKRTVQDVYENKEKLLSVKERYNKIFKTYDGKLLIVKGDQNPQQIHLEIVKYFESHF
ncbi:dTMP kinase [Pontibacillus litoralis]|uniref:Thymidylate kinase n=1 Tax=Pontibacillus litoralis JSM 072002 TaxID=1385512 RepID=A0A0A5G2Z9_9BACI|nr:dTMP kinase [Pontibacillus litoralis]KGX85455.1 thymidylate kinase [Pontibacillus litoralis JSM 072002]